MKKQINFKEIESQLLKTPCPICQYYPESVSISNLIFAMTVNCDHDFLTLLNKKYLELRDEQLGI
jgi:hypothetical protein